MAGGNFDGQAYITGPADSVDQQDSRGTGFGFAKSDLFKRLRTGLGTDPRFQGLDPRFLELIKSLMGYGGAQHEM